MQLDNEDREKELNLMKRMMELCDKMHSLASVSVVQAEVVSQNLLRSEKKRDNIVEDVLKVEEEVTSIAVATEEKYVSKFKLHAAGIATLHASYLFSLMLLLFFKP